MPDNSLNKVWAVIDNAKRQGISFFSENGKIKFKVPKDQVIAPELLAEIKQYKEEIKAILDDSIQARTTTTDIPLSFSQERIWVIDQLEGSINYHIPAVFRMNGKLDIAALAHALRTIVNRHEVLRTVIQQEAGKASQRILNNNQWELAVIDDLVYKGDAAALQARIQSLMTAPFDLSKDHMLRAYLIVLHENAHVLVVVMHHIAADGWSAAIIVKELIALYEAHTAGHPVPLSPPGLQYADFSCWQRQHMSGAVLDAKLAYWRKQLAGVPALDVPGDYTRPAVQSTRGATYAFRLNRELTAQLQELSRRQEVTLFMTLLTVFKILLYRYSGQEDICVGSPIAGRTQNDTEGMVGLFVNTLALRSHLGNNPSFISLLQQVKANTLAAYDHQEVPFEKIVEAVVKERDPGRNPLFQVMFELQNLPAVPALRLGGVSLVQEEVNHHTSKFDLTVSLSEHEEGLAGHVEYCTDLFQPATIRQMLTHFEQLLRSVVSEPASPIGALPMLTPAEEQELLKEFNNTYRPYPAHATLMELFAAQAAATPEATALVLEGNTVSYQELDERSNQLGHYLRSKGIMAESLVPICLERSFEMIIGILGILKAGGAYVPIDPAYPAERISVMLDDCGDNRIVVTTTAYSDRFRLMNRQPVCLDDADEERLLQPLTSVYNEAGAAQLAYMIYTSGSTGKPKGVMITHTAVVNMIYNRTKDLGIDHTDRIVQFSSFCFDAAVEQMYLALLNGAVLVLIPESIRLDKELFARMLEQQRVTHIDATPGFLATITPGTYGHLKRIVSGGEACNLPLAAAWSKYVAFYNEYGPTETTVIAAGYLFTNDNTGNRDILPIGKPLANTSAYILDTHGNVVPVGVPGELHIGGVQVARGYWRRPDLTNEKFIPDRFSDRAGARMYKTGDLCRWLPGGLLEYLGRMDEQVKIRGYRIELGEIENVLQQCELVRQGVVLAKTDAAGNRRLVGYIVPNGEFDKAGIMAHLRSRMPDYMVPAVLIALAALPLTTNDKVDKKALPEPGADELSTTLYTAPRNSTEELLAGIWQELLGVQRIGVYNNFFELGGDSIITIQVVSRVRRAGYVLQPRDIFMYQTIDRLAPVLTIQQETTSSAEQGLLSGSCGLLPVQQWYFQTARTIDAHFNQSVLLRINKDIDAAALETAIRQLVRQHDALRFVYKPGETAWEQEYGTYEGRLEIADLQALPANELEEAIREYGRQYHRKLDITQGILLRTLLLVTPAGEPDNRLMIIIHHLAIDGVSWRILLEDLEQLLKSKDAVLGPKSNSYRQWYQQLADYSNETRLVSQQPYWKKIAESYVPLRVDKPYEGIVTKGDTGTCEVRLSDRQTLKLLQEAPRAYHTEINDILLCALALTLTAWNNTSKIVIGLEGHGREELAKDIDTSHTVGWFTSLYPVLLELPAGAHLGACLKEIKEQLRKTPGKGLGYGVLKYINKADGLQGKEPWDIIFNYLGQSDNVVKEDGYITLATESAGPGMGDDFPFPEKLSIDSMIAQGELVLQWSYSSKHYTPESIAALAGSYMAQLELLIAHCAEQAQTLPVHTPSDYGLGGLITNEELDRFLDSEYQGAPRRHQVESIYRLSGLQEGMLFHGLYDDQSGAYLEQVSAELGELDETVFRESWAHLLQRHSILRSGFYYDAFPIPVQVVYRQVALPVTIHDYRQLDETARAQAVQAYIAADSQQGFDFGAAPLMRISLLRLEDDRYRMVWTSHHILLDGWSLPVLVAALLQTYELLVNGKSLPAAPEDRYEDYIRYLERQDKQAAGNHWHTYLQGLTESCLLPFIGAVAERTKGVGVYKEKKVGFDAGTTTRLNQYAQRHHITLNTMMQGVWAYLLYRYTGHQNIVFGTTVSGRPDNLPGIEQRVGLYINTLPLHMQLQNEKRITDWLQELQASQLANREYQYAALTEIQQLTGLSGDLFDSSITFQNYPVSEVLASDNWQLKVSDIQTHPHANYPLTIIIGAGREIGILFSYNNNLLATTYIEAIAGHFRQVLLQMLDDNTVLLGDLTLLTKAEQEQLQVTFNDTGVAYPQHKTIVDLFEQQAVLTPNAIAAVFEDQALTYQQLDEQTNQLAHYLRHQGVGVETLVPILLERSLEMIIGILGILKAGGAYVPIDPEYPAERISFMLEDTGATVVVTSNPCMDRLPLTAGITGIALDEYAATFSGYSKLPLHVRPAPHHLAYVIYTSGTTGRPKGVMNEHSGLLNRLLWTQDYFRLNASDAVLQKTTYCFDVSVWELLWPLISGARLVFALPEGQKDADYLKTVIAEQGITTIHFVPSMLHVFLENLATTDAGALSVLRRVLCSGEALLPQQVELFRSKGLSAGLYNLYGPTEAAIDVTCWQVPVDAGDISMVPIGRPVANTRLYILDKQGSITPLGVPGELHIGGVQVARGYLKRPELNREKFIKDPFSDQPGARLYRTGDHCRWLPDGTIEYFGRIDQQVKIRGFRIELGEIENVLNQCSLVKQSVVLAKTFNGNKQLVGYIVPEGGFDRPGISSYLQQQLPEYMVPALLIALDALPVTANGKVNKKALPDPDASALLTNEYVAPRNDVEQQLAAIWQQLLVIERTGIYDNFFELGGNSLMSMRLASALRKQLQVALPVKSLFLHPTIAALAAHIRELDTSTGSAIDTVIRPLQIPLSYSQERLWFIDKMGGSTHYHIPAVLRLKGHLNKAALAHALQTIVNRHEVLRTVIVQDEGEPYQRILDKDQWHLQVIDDTRYEDEAALQQCIQQLTAAPFDLSADHMLRAHLIVLGAAAHVLVITMHHIVSDGWSAGIIIKEVTALYEAAVTGYAAELPPLPIQYADYATWQRQYMSGAVLEQQLQYWQHQLSGAETLQLPTDRPRPALQSTRGNTHVFRFSRELTAQLQKLSRQQDTTLFMTLLAAFNVLLHRYSGQSDICVGTPVAGRTRQELEGLIGFFVNTLVVRSNLGEAPAFTTLLQQIKQTMLEAYEHQDVPFEKIVDRVVQERDMSRTPLFQVMFTLQNTPEAPDLHLDGLHFEQAPSAHQTSIFDLTISFKEHSDGCSGYIEYCEDLFLPGTISRLIGHFEQLLRGIVADPAQSIASLKLLTPAEEQQLLITFNDTAANYPTDKTIIDVFEERVRQAPQATALICNDQLLTYQELNERANQLSRYLQKQGVTTESRVPLCIERSFEMIIAILGILKAGGVYVPVDPDYPIDRISYMLTDTAAQIAVSSSSCAGKLAAAVPNLPVISMDQSTSRINRYAKTAPGVSLQAGQLAYIIYTSGSTGKPKGVMLEHKGVVNLALSQAAALRLQPGTRSLQFASFGFDASCYEIFNTLLSGGVLVLPHKEDLLSAEKFAALTTKHAVELVTLPPSYQHIIKEYLGPIKTIVSAGEPLNPDDARYMQSRGVRVVNAYGPTENTVCTSLTDDPIRKDHVITIGAPIANVQVYILGVNGDLCPIGIPGEICIGGAGLARGYWNRAELTAEKFIANPFSHQWDGRLYRTGDLGRWLADGHIEFLGRLDDQVKIRGYRIELGEIENVLKASALAGQAVVLAKMVNGNKQLVAYIEGAFDKEAIQAHLQQRLPEYMVPSIYITLDQLPLTPSGKIDRKALSVMDDAAGALATTAYVAPRNALELKLAALWQQLLGRSPIGIYDNFFEMGGHSLLAMRLLSAVRKSLQVELPIRTLFQFPTIAGLSQQVGEADNRFSLPPVEARMHTGPIPLSYSQERLWFIDQLEGSLHYHIPIILRLKGRLNRAALEFSLSTLVNRHEVLRTVIAGEDGMAAQRILEENSWRLQVIEGMLYKEAGTVPEGILRSLISHPFDLSQDHMLRAHLLVLGAEEHLLVVTLHHIAADGWSTGIIVRELAALYDAYENGSKALLPALTIQYADYAIWQRTYLPLVLAQHLDYWKGKLAGVAPLNLPVDQARPALQSTRGAVKFLHLDETLCAQLKILSHQQGATLFMTLLAAFKVLLYRYSNQEDICIGTSIAGRTRAETEGLIGLFVNTLALRSNLGNNPSFTELLQQVRETTLHAYEYQDVPFEKIVEAVVKERDVSRTPLFQVMFELQNTPDAPELRLGEMVLIHEGIEDGTAKFDINMSLHEEAGGLSGYVEYCADLFNADTIDRLIGHYEQLLRAVVHDPGNTINALQLLTPAEAHQLLVQFNDTEVPYPADKTLIELFGSQAARIPEAVALVFGSSTLTYQLLHERTNQLARYLRSKGVKADVLVPVCIERSLEMVVGILGILKAGGAYVPIDPAYPPERIRFMLEDGGATVVLTSKVIKENMVSTSGLEVIALDSEWDNMARLSVEPLEEAPATHDLCYMIYTSGSTGKPKGVMVEHRGMLNHLFAKINDLHIDNNTRLALTASYTFDISVWQMFAALVCGGTTVIYPEQVVLDAAALLQAVDRDRITILELVPSHLSALLQEAAVPLKSLQFLLVTGEVVSRHLLQQWFSHPHYGAIPVVNAYGPTEASDDICHYFMYAAPDRTNIPLGTPVQNLRIYILDQQMQLCPIGVQGEICVSGIGVSRGYRNRADLTAEKFVPDPFSADSSARMYRTGDLGRWLPDGNIEYAGRMDEQVKIRGYRIELGEIESALEQCEGVGQAVVLVKTDNAGYKRLIGYVVPEGACNKATVLNSLKEKLPEYMVPAALVLLAQLPLTANGKIDKRALPEPDTISLSAHEYVAPRNEVEQTLAAIWQELLEVERVGIYDNFFELGGHSLQVMRLLAGVRRSLQADISVRTFFQLATIESLAKYIKVNQHATVATEDLQTIKL